MKHYIIVKFKDKNIIDKEFESINQIFMGCLKVEGVHKVELKKNVINRDNRFDLMIEITMDKESLVVYDNCSSHHKWKDTYSSLIEKKTIIDIE